MCSSSVGAGKGRLSTKPRPYDLPQAALGPGAAELQELLDGDPGAATLGGAAACEPATLNLSGPRDTKLAIPRTRLLG